MTDERGAPASRTTNIRSPPGQNPAVRSNTHKTLPIKIKFKIHSLSTVRPGAAPSHDRREPDLDPFKFRPANPRDIPR